MRRSTVNQIPASNGTRRIRGAEVAVELLFVSSAFAFCLPLVWLRISPFNGQSPAHSLTVADALVLVYAFVVAAPASLWTLLRLCRLTREVRRVSSGTCSNCGFGIGSADLRSGRCLDCGHELRCAGLTGDDDDPCALKRTLRKDAVLLIGLLLSGLFFTALGVSIFGALVEWFDAGMRDFLSAVAPAVLPVVFICFLVGSNRKPMRLGSVAHRD
jgi:hypothetical protein